MTSQLKINMAAPIEYALPLRAERVEGSTVMARIVDATGMPVCSVCNYELALKMAAGPEAYDFVGLAMQTWWRAVNATDNKIRALGESIFRRVNPSAAVPYDGSHLVIREEVR